MLKGKSGSHGSQNAALAVVEVGQNPINNIFRISRGRGVDREV